MMTEANPTVSTPAEATPPRKWTTAEPYPGPIQLSKVNKLLQKCSYACAGTVEITGRHGKPETEMRCVSHTLYGGDDRSAEGKAILAALGDKYGWMVTKANAAALAKDLEESIPALEATRPINDKRLTTEQAIEDDKQKAAYAEKCRAESEASAKISAAKVERFLAELAKAPRGTCALVVAELVKDESDSMTDYFGSTVTKRVAIGWRTGEREDFRQLRAAAAGFEHTKHLGVGCDDYRVVAVRTVKGDGYANEVGRYYMPAPALHGKNFATEAECNAAIAAAVAADAPDAYEWKIETHSVEHRDNWSMGGGNYLAVGGQHSSGWHVKSMSVESCRKGPYNMPDEWAIPERASVPAGSDSAPVIGSGYTVQKYTHTKKGTDYWQVELADRVDEDAFNRLRSSCKSAGGWYSRKWGSIPGGFAFESEAAAIGWAASAIK